MKTRTLLLVLAALLAPLPFSACSSAPPSQRLERLFDELEQELGERKLGSGDGEAWQVRQKERIAKVREMIAAHEVVSARDHLFAAVILTETDLDEDLATARELALKSAELGEPKGFRVAAEAVDKQLVKRGAPQKYGTQYLYEPVLRGWRLYPVDPATSDAERQAMGVEPLEQLRAREKQLNEITGGRPN